MAARGQKLALQLSELSDDVRHRDDIVSPERVFQSAETGQVGQDESPHGKKKRCESILTAWERESRVV